MVSTLGDFIIKKRKELNLTHKELAIRSKLDELSILLIESGEMIPTMLQNYNLAMALEHEPSELVRLSLGDEREKEQLVSNKEPSDPLSIYEHLVEKNYDNDSNPVQLINLTKIINDFKKENKEIYFYTDDTDYLFDGISTIKSFKMYEQNCLIINSSVE